MRPAPPAGVRFRVRAPSAISGSGALTADGVPLGVLTLTQPSTMPKSLRRSTTDSMIAGVIGGMAEFFELDATLLRVVYVILSIVSVAFPGILVYLILWFLIPKADQG